MKLSAEGKHLMEHVHDAGRLHKRRLLQRPDTQSLAHIADVMDAFNAAAESERNKTDKPTI